MLGGAVAEERDLTYHTNLKTVGDDSLPNDSPQTFQELEELSKLLERERPILE